MRMDKDRFRRDLGNVAEAYQEVARRLGILPEGDLTELQSPSEDPEAGNTSPEDGESAQ